MSRYIPTQNYGQVYQEPRQSGFFPEQFSLPNRNSQPNELAKLIARYNYNRYYTEIINDSQARINFSKFDNSPYNKLPLYWHLISVIYTDYLNKRRESPDSIESIINSVNRYFNNDVDKLDTPKRNNGEDLPLMTVPININNRFKSLNIPDILAPYIMPIIVNKQEVSGQMIATEIKVAKISKSTIPTLISKIIIPILVNITGDFSGLDRYKYEDIKERLQANAKKFEDGDIDEEEYYTIEENIFRDLRPIQNILNTRERDNSNIYNRLIKRKITAQQAIDVAKSREYATNANYRVKVVLHTYVKRTISIFDNTINMRVKKTAIFPEYVNSYFTRSVGVCAKSIEQRLYSLFEESSQSSITDNDALYLESLTVFFYPDVSRAIYGNNIRIKEINDKYCIIDNMAATRCIFYAVITAYSWQDIPELLTQHIVQCQQARNLVKRLKRVQEIDHLDGFETIALLATYLNVEIKLYDLMFDNIQNYSGSNPTKTIRLFYTMNHVAALIPWQDIENANIQINKDCILYKFLQLEDTDPDNIINNNNNNNDKCIAIKQQKRELYFNGNISTIEFDDHDRITMTFLHSSWTFNNYDELLLFIEHNAEKFKGYTIYTHSARSEDIEKLLINLIINKNIKINTSRTNYNGPTLLRLSFIVKKTIINIHDSYNLFKFDKDEFIKSVDGATNYFTALYTTFKKWFDLDGINLTKCLTMSGLARRDTYTNGIDLKKYPQYCPTLAVRELLRDCVQLYGRLQPFKNGKYMGKFGLYDFNSSYLRALTEPLPYDNIELINDEYHNAEVHIIEYYSNKKINFISVEVRHNDDDANNSPYCKRTGIKPPPYLPIKINNLQEYPIIENYRVMLINSVCIPMLIEIGVKFRAIYDSNSNIYRVSGLSWSSAPYLKTYALNQFERRQNFKKEKNNIMNQIQKLKNVCCWGHFSQKTDNVPNYKISDGSDYVRYLVFDKLISINKISTDYKLMSVLDSSKRPQILPQVGATVIEYGRLYLYRLMLDILENGGHIYYTATDSIITDLVIDENSPLYGQYMLPCSELGYLGKLKTETISDIVEIYGPNIYRIGDIVKLGGIENPDDKFDELIDTGSAYRERFTSIVDKNSVLKDTKKYELCDYYSATRLEINRDIFDVVFPRV